jgi:hypothetical protein
VATKVFISYRRDDTASDAGRIYDRLSQLLRSSNVFFDVSAIGGGEDFMAEVTSAIRRSDVALIFIGERWIGPQPSGTHRIAEPEDHVRAEVRAALSGSLRLLPILVAHARMPTPGELPEDIRGITKKNALRLRHESFDADADAIVSAILGTPAKPRVWEKKSKLWNKIMYATGGGAAAAIILIATAIVHFWLFKRSIAASIGGPQTTLLLLTGLLIGAALGLFCASRRARTQRLDTLSH